MLRISSRTAEPAEPYVGPRWEYKFTRPTFPTGDLIEFNQLGEQGWEYVGVTLHDDKRCIFRRRRA